MFDELPQRTLSAYNYMVAGYLNQGLVAESINLVHRLILDGERPDGYTYSMILKASTSGGNVILPPNSAGVVHAQIVKSYVEPDDVLSTALVDAYVKSGRVGLLENAEEIFEKTVEKDVVVFNAMIEGYSKSLETALKALDVYVEMQRFGFRPNLSTFASVTGACSLLAGFEIAQQVQAQLLKSGFYTDIKMGSALIDMYSKCGRIEDARRVF
ncbi:hypothetical protein GH714_000911 [Hevea brasiliensis]|uniref:Pentacotripeptide-repeat region of PRORP domain-containing protein n=1 Tax=Hevea brasiliensis TaxID=3981 RepID=A0A6A6LSW1_HEVBR|nr:hypothetical protein GH714_000911 [Hevea brasiliensis]